MQDVRDGINMQITFAKIWEKAVSIDIVSMIHHTMYSTDS